MSRDLYLDIHKLLLVRIVAPERRLANLIQTRLGWLVVEKPDSEPALVLRAVDDLQGLRPDNRLPLQMIPDADETQWCAGVQKADRPQILLCPGPPTELRYVPKNTSMGRVWWVFLITLRRLLMRSGAMLCHGAVVARNGHGLLLAGHRGQGKTSLTLRLLHEGWDYVAEDKFILWGGVAHAFEQQMRLLPYHAPLFDKNSPLSAQLEKLQRRRQRALPFMQPLLKLLPGQVSERVRSRLDRSISVRMEQLEGHGLFLENVAVRDVILMRYDAAPARKTSPEQGAMAFSQLQGIAFAELHALDYLFDYYAHDATQDLATLAQTNLRGAHFRCLNPRRPEDWEFLEDFQ